MELSPQHIFSTEYLKVNCVFNSASKAGIALSESIPPGYYVYFLIEKETGRIFYVGKGKGKRVKTHFMPHKIENVFKSYEIDDIKERGNTPSFVIFHQAKSEAEAFQVERELINALLPTGLTNEVAGSTSLLEKEKLKAKRLLDSILPFDLWKAIRKPTNDSIDNYHFIVNELQQIVALP